VSARGLAHARNPVAFLELALVTVVIGVAAAVAVPEYLHLRQDVGADAAKSRLSQAAKTLERRHASAGTFAGATLPAGVHLAAAGRGSFCVDTKTGGNAWHVGPSGKPASGAC
jgi:Tfp pilus assembly protein PilE